MRRWERCCSPSGWRYAGSPPPTLTGCWPWTVIAPGCSASWTARPSRGRRSRPRCCRASWAGTRVHPGFGCWAAEARRDGGFVGWFGLRPVRPTAAATAHWPDALPGPVTAGYRPGRAPGGRGPADDAPVGVGYATEGARALVRRAFTELGVARIVAITRPGPRPEGDGQDWLGSVIRARNSGVCVAVSSSSSRNGRSKVSIFGGADPHGGAHGHAGRRGGGRPGRGDVHRVLLDDLGDLAVLRAQPGVVAGQRQAHRGQRGLQAVPGLAELEPGQPHAGGAGRWTRWSARSTGPPWGRRNWPCAPVAATQPRPVRARRTAAWPTASRPPGGSRPPGRCCSSSAPGRRRPPAVWNGAGLAAGNGCCQRALR